MKNGALFKAQVLNVLEDEILAMPDASDPASLKGYGECVEFVTKERMETLLPFHNLISHLSFGRHLAQTSDPRDKIYGALSLAVDANLLGIVPDYSLSCEDVSVIQQEE
jgi:hypothetical protein